MDDALNKGRAHLFSQFEKCTSEISNFCHILNCPENFRIQLLPKTDYHLVMHFFKNYISLIMLLELF